LTGNFEPIINCPWREVNFDLRDRSISIFRDIDFEKAGKNEPASA